MDGEIRHDLLKSTFPQLTRLHAWLSAILPEHVIVMRPGDTDNFTRLLRGTLITVRDGAPPIPKDLLLQQTDQHQSLVNGVVAELFRLDGSKKSRHVLCLGMINAKSLDIHTMDGIVGVECVWPNSAQNIVRGMSWQTLHERIGSDLFRYVLKHTIVFVELPKNCFLQVCGPSFWHFVKTTTSTAPDPTTMPPASSKKSQKSIPRVRRWEMFYNDVFLKKPGFEPKHFFMSPSCRPTMNVAKKLCRKILKLNPKARLRAKHRHLLEILRKMIRKHQKIRYGFLLRVCCPLPERTYAEELTVEDILGETFSYKDLVAKYVDDFFVCKFVWACVCRLIPKSFWGCQVNKNVFFCMLNSFIRMRRYEDFNLQFWAAKWKMRSCSWLEKIATRGRFESQRRMVILILRWLMQKIVMPLLRNHFYITESAVHKNKVFYYRKPLWKQLVVSDLGVSNSKNVLKGMFHPITAQQAEAFLSNRFGLPASKIRLIPKVSGMRMIANLSQRQILGERGYSDSTNFLLKPYFSVLQFELQRKSHLLGASVFDLNEAHKKLLNFLLWFRQKTPSSAVPLYFVSVDVKTSFDSVNQTKLCQILFNEDEEIWECDKYVLQRYSVFLPCGGNVATSMKSNTVPVGELRPLHHTLRQSLDFGTSVRNSVLLDNSQCKYVSRDDAKDILRTHISNHVVRFRGQYYLQRVGIPQGSVFSSLLCSLFYGHMERNGLSDLPLNFDPSAPDHSKGTLVRLIDDNLFVTTSKEAAVEFVSRLSNRFVNDYGTQLNAAKTVVNFVCRGLNGIQLPLAQSNSAYPSDNPCLPWCGVLIDVVTFEFYGDYTKFSGNYMNETLTVSMSHPGASLLQKLKQFAQPKCIALLLDSRINRPVVVHLNVYHIFMLCAIKYHCHIRMLPSVDNQSFMLSIILDLIEFTNTLIQGRIKDGVAAEGLLSPQYVRYLGRHAFRTVLIRKQAVYRDVLAALQRDLCSSSYFAGLEEKVKHAIDPKRSVLFHKLILY